MKAMRSVLASASVTLALSLPGRAAADDANPNDRTAHSGAESARAPSDDETRADTPNRDAPSGDDCAAERPARAPATTALGTVAVLVPGVLVHGSGHLAVGESKTGLRLLALEGVGLGVLAAGFVPVVLTGASRRLMGPAIALSVAGVGLLAISFLGDLYGIVAPAGGAGAPPRALPVLQTVMGYRYVYDPVFSYRHFMVQEIDYRTGAWRLHPSAWFALDDTNSRLRAHFAYRLMGPLPELKPGSHDGSFIDVETAITRHAFTSSRFATTTGELAVAGRVDMARLGPSLRGSFAEMSVGWALQAYSYDLRGTSADVGEVLLARFGYGMYIGWPGSPRGEITLYYDHRHDDFAAGLKTPGLGSGVAGHFGAEAHLFVSNHWGVAAEAAVGSAYLTGLSILFRHGDPL